MRLLSINIGSIDHTATRESLEQRNFCTQFLPLFCSVVNQVCVCNHRPLLVERMRRFFQLLCELKSCAALLTAWRRFAHWAEGEQHGHSYGSRRREEWLSEFLLARTLQLPSNPSKRSAKPCGTKNDDGKSMTLIRGLMRKSNNFLLISLSTPLLTVVENYLRVTLEQHTGLNISFYQYDKYY